MSLAVFATYVLSSPDNYLDPITAFVSLNLIGILNWTLNLMPTAISSVAQVGKYYCDHKPPLGDPGLVVNAFYCCYFKGVCVTEEDQRVLAAGGT